jgi:Tol biopolymer transport system component
VDRYFSGALYDRAAGELVELPEGFYELETLSFSPSGKKAVACRGGEAVLFDFEAGEERVLCSCGAAFRWYRPAGRMISWSPDERRLAAAAPLEDDDEIYVFDLDSGEMTPLTRDDAPDHSPVWSPDGGRLAYVSVEGDRDCLRVISPGSGEEFVVVCSDRALGYPRWRPGTAQGSRGSKR